MKKVKVIIIIFLIIILLTVLYFLGFGVHEVYQYEYEFGDGKNYTKKIAYTKNYKNAQAYFDYSDERLKIKSKWYIGKFFVAPCFAFGCNSNPDVSIWIPLFNITKSLPVNCSISYIDIKQEEKKFQYHSNDPTYKSPDPTGLGHYYELACQPGIEEEERLGYWVYSERFYPADDIVAKHPNTLGVLIQRGYSLPTADNTTIPLRTKR